MKKSTKATDSANKESVFQNLSKEERIALTVFFLTPLVALLFLEYANPAGPGLIFYSIRPSCLLRFGVTAFLFYIVMGFLFALTGSMRFSGCFLCIFSIIFSLTNYFTTTFRGIPILASDLTIMGTAMNVVGNYKYSLDLTRTITLLGLITWCILLFRVKRLRLPKGKKRISAILGSAAICFASFWIMIYTPVMTVTPMHVTVNTFRPIKSYRKNGCVLTFMRSIQLMIIHKPDGYSANAAEEIAAPYRSETSSGNAKTPNVIAIMDEAFADLQAVGDFRTSEDVMPFYHSLTKNTVKGFSYVSVFGGQTANTEFEFLTGLSKAFVPASATPYQLYIKSLLPGLTTHLGKQDYQGMLAFHPFRANGYNRDHVYPNLGFSDFISLKDLDVSASDKIRNFVSDAADFQVIIDQYEQAKKKSNAPFYLFNVTMQNHSGYAQGWNNLERTISLPDSLKLADSNAEQYFALARQTDNALKELIGYYSQCDEPTMIVFFGDHQPPLKNAFYERLYGKPLDQRTTEEVMRQYAVPFFIWTNYDLSGAEADMQTEDVVISPNYLGVLTAKLAGLPLTGYMNFLDQMYAELPAITPVGFVTRDGDFLSKKELSDQQQDWLDQYAILNYCGMVDLFDQARPMFCMEEN